MPRPSIKLREGDPPPLTATARRSSSRNEAAADVFLATDVDALLFVGKLLGQVQLYGVKGEEGGSDRQRWVNPGLLMRKFKIIGGDRRLLAGRPPTHPHSEVLPAAQVEQGNLSSARMPVRHSGEVS